MNSNKRGRIYRPFPIISYNHDVILYKKLIIRYTQKKDLQPLLIEGPQSWRLPTLPLGIAVPSALTGLTSLFGMGRGGSPSLLPPLFIAGSWLFNVRHSLYGVREKKDIGLFCFVYFYLIHAPQLKCRAISTARL